MPQTSEQFRADQDRGEEAQPQQGGKRAEVIQRLQIGLFGLAAMVLIVALANVIMERAKQTEATAVPEAAATTAPVTATGSLSDPLVDAGVVPDMPSNAQKNTAPRASPVPNGAPTLAPRP